MGNYYFLLLISMTCHVPHKPRNQGFGQTLSSHGDHPPLPLPLSFPCLVVSSNGIFYNDCKNLLMDIILEKNAMLYFTFK